MSYEPNTNPEQDEAEQEKEKLYFFTVKWKKQKQLMTVALPSLKAFLKEIRRISRIQEGGEKLKAAREAQSRLTSAEAALLLPSNNDKAEYQEKVINARIEAMNAIEEAEKERTELGFDLLETVIDNFFTEYSDKALSILSVLTNKSTETLEEEHDLFELSGMLFDVLEDPGVQSFLSRARRLKSIMH